MHPGRLGFASRGLSRVSGALNSFEGGYKDDAVCKWKLLEKKCGLTSELGEGGASSITGFCTVNTFSTTSRLFRLFEGTVQRDGSRFNALSTAANSRGSGLLTNWFSKD